MRYLTNAEVFWLVWLGASEKYRRKSRILSITEVNVHKKNVELIYLVNKSPLDIRFDL